LYECLDVGLGYMQILSTVFNFNSMYTPEQHSSLYNLINTICQLVNMNVDYVSPSCFMPWGYTYGYYLLLIIPTIPFAISAAVTLLAFFWSRKIKVRKVRGR
jgi:hypothetical protein